MNLPPSVDPQLLRKVFRQESAANCQEMKVALDQLGVEPGNDRARRQVVCVVHSLKSNALLFDLGHLAARAEALEERLEEEALPWEGARMDALRALAQALEQGVARALAGGEELSSEEEALFDAALS